MSSRYLLDPLPHQLGYGSRPVTSPGDERELDMLPVPEPTLAAGDLGQGGG